MRCGPHVMGAMPPGTPARAMYERWVTIVRPPLVKFCRQGFDPALMQWTRAQGVKIVGRWVEGDINDGRQTLNELLPFADCLDYIEFANEEEQGKDDPKEWDRLLGKCLDFMRDLDERNRQAGRTGPKVCFVNASVGQPEIDRWDRQSTLEAARYAAANGHIWGLHAYYKPTPWAGLLHQHSEGSADEKALWDGPAGSPRGWLMLREVRAIDRMKANGITGFRFAITESGRDAVPGQPGPGGGFRDVPGEPFDEYMRQYGRHLSALPECVGWVDFGYNAWEGWKQFDLTLDPAMHERFITAQLLLPGTATSPPPPPPPPPEVTMILGIDVSHWQGQVDWAKAAAQGVRFAWIKAGEGTSGIDPRYHENARAADAAGILWGPYHYWRAGMGGQAQAAHFAGIVRAGPAPRLAPACDLEDTKSTPLVTDVRLYVDSVQSAFGVVPVIYTARWWWNGYLQGAATAGSWAAGHPLWVASYTGDPARAPSLPTPWTTATVHQYTNALDGPRFGATSAKLDGNAYRGTDSDLVAAVGAAGMPAPGPAPLDVAELVRQVEAAHQAAGIRLNPQAALQRAMRADGLVPTLNEADYTIGGQAVVASRGESMAGGQATVYWWDAKTGRAMKRAV